MKATRLSPVFTVKPVLAIRLVAPAILLLSIALAPAATRTWLNPGGGLWRNAGNWSGGVVPDSNDTVIISVDGTYTVTVEQTATFASLVLGGGTGTQTLRWTGGSLSGNITIQAGAELRFGITGFNSLFGDGDVNNHGTIIWEPTAVQPWTLNSASIVNHTGALIDLQRDGTFSRFSGAPFILNNGTMRKSGGTGLFSFNSNIAITNRGVVQIQAGTMHFTDGFTSSSGFEVSAGARLDLHNGTFNLEPGHNVTGAGDYGVFNGGGPIINGPIIHNNFLLDSGVLSMTNELRGAVRWRGGSLDTDITITPTGVLSYEITGFNSLHSGTITNQGLIRWHTNAVQPWFMSAGSILNSAGGLIDLQRDSTFSRHAGNPFIHNLGIIRKSGGSGFATFNSNIAITNRGAVQIQTGTMQFTDGFTSSSGFDVSAGAFLDLHNGFFNLEPGHNVTGAGSYGIFNGGGPVINGPIIHNNFLLDSGVLSMTNELRGTVRWRGGSLDTDIIITPTGVLSYEITSFNSLHSGVITNQGLIRWNTNATQPWSMSTGSILNSAGGLIDLQRDSTFSRHTGNPFIHNLGAICKSGGSGFATFNSNIAITNRGAIQIQTGAMQFTDGFTSSSGFEVSAGARLDVHNGTFNLEPGHNVTGLGTYGIFSGGGPVINGPIIHTNFLVDGGVLHMTNEVRGVIRWRGGSLATDITITPTGVLSYEITGFNSLHSGLITNQGLIRWATNAVQPWFMSTGSILNSAGGLIDLQRDSTFSRHTGNPFIHNLGAIRKSGGTGFATFNSGIAFTNTGIIEALSGTLDFNGDYDMTGGLLKFGISGNSQFGKIDVNGNAPLVGGLGAMLLNGFVPATNVSFQVMTFGSRSGTFADTTGLNVGSGRAFAPVYTATTLSLLSHATNDVVITSQPQGATVVAGMPAEFSVIASGTGQLTYQWRRNGVPLPNTDTNRLVIPNAQPANAGAYDVIITSTAGSATSLGAPLVVHVPPMLSLPPVSQQLSSGQTATFTVAANGNPPPTFQWLFNGVPIPGATGSQYTVPAAMANNVGSYSVVVSNVAGVVTNTANLTLVDLKMFAGIIIDGESNRQFRVEFTTDVGTPTTNWTSLGTITIINRPTYFFDVNSPDQPHRFYRAVPLP